MKPRIFLGSSVKQSKLLRALQGGLAEIADVQPWTTAINVGNSTLERLVELTHQVDFAAFVFAHDDWISDPSDATGKGQASPRDNVVFEAGLFGGTLGMRRTFILHAEGAKLPTDLLGMTNVRYKENLTPAEMKAVYKKLRKAIEDEGRITPLEGDWWQHSYTQPTEPRSVISLMRISRGSGRCSRHQRSILADGRCAFGNVPKRTFEGEQRPAQNQLLLDGRASAGQERTAVRGHRRNIASGA